MKYFEEIQFAMDWLGERPDTIFLGQTVGCPGTFMYPTLSGVDINKRLEFPVNESFQMQFTLGLALAGYVPISVYPRQNFLLLTISDLVNMIDKIPALTNKEIEPKLIIRTATGPDSPIHPGHQHVGDFTEAFKKMFTNGIDVIQVNEAVDIVPAYKYAYQRRDCKSTLIIENGNFYHK